MSDNPLPTLNQVARVIRNVIELCESPEEFDLVAAFRVSECIANDFILTLPSGRQFKVNVKEVKK